MQVIAASGGTEEKAKIPDVMVVRTENGQRMAYTINLQSKDLFDSPVYWLQQNDLVYVKPRGLRLSTGGDLFLKIFSPAIAAISSVAYMLLWTAR
jgi:polysaccharide export outer membrane protein